MVLCGVCGIKEFKYKCPRCLEQTCSLECSKKHKVRDKCSGQTHDPKEYVSSETLKQADDEKHERNAYVQRDYNYLTQLKRMVQVQKMDARMKNKRVLGPARASGNLKRRRYDVDEDDRDIMECQRIIRRGVNCLMLPKGMQRSSQNRSKWDKTMDLFVWSVEWILCPVQGKGEKKEAFKHVSHRIKETDLLIQGMGKNVFQKCCEFYCLAGTSCLEAVSYTHLSILKEFKSFKKDDAVRKAERDLEKLHKDYVGKLHDQFQQVEKSVTK